MNDSYSKQALERAEKNKGNLMVGSLSDITTKEDLSVVYTPGVGALSSHIAEHPEAVWTHTMKGRSVAVVTDGTAVLGLGDIGPEAALPVMEGKCALFKKFGDVDAIPLCLNTKNTDEIVSIITALAPTFGGINLEDVSAPRCFEIEKRLNNIGIPVFHDDQHGTAIVVLSALINASKVVHKELSSLNIVINGAGAAGIAIAKILIGAGQDVSLVKSITMIDSKGIIHSQRTDLNSNKQELLPYINNTKSGDLMDAVQGVDVLIGVSEANVFLKDHIVHMADNPIVFALANPYPEILPDDAKRAGASIVATGRSDYPNQINNVLVFPGIFKGALKHNVKNITFNMMRSASYALAQLVEHPTHDTIIPSVFDSRVADTIADVIRKDN